MESIPSDHNSYSESSGTTSELASSSSKESTLPAKYTDDNEETPLKKLHPRPWTSKKEVLDTIKKLKITKNTLSNSGMKYIHDDIFNCVFVTIHGTPDRSMYYCLR